MLATKPVGRNAAALKYDILSALGVHALSQDKHRQRLILRLIVLITTRYNWQSDELSIGRTEIARLWSVDERTVKRELAKLKALGWVSVKRDGARGRVAVYAIDLRQVLLDTRGAWEGIGPDFLARVETAQGIAPAPEDPKVVPFQRPGRAVEGQGGVWGQVLALLDARDPALTATWFTRLEEIERAGGRAVLLAPSGFVADYVRTHLRARLLAAYSQVDPSVRVVEVLVAG